MIRQLTPADADAYRAFMLDLYDRQRDVFTATVAEREPLPMAWWIDRVSDAPTAPQRVLGALAERQIVGTVGLRVETRPRTRHKATVFGLAVHPSVRGQGLGRALVQAVLNDALAIPGVEVLQLQVFASNTPARRLYGSFGFEVYGTEPMAVRVGEQLVPVMHMWRGLRDSP